MVLLSGSKSVLLLRPAEAEKLGYQPATDVGAGTAGAGALVSDNHAFEADGFVQGGRASLGDAEWAGGAAGLTCHLEAGEVLFIPFRWHHAVRTEPAADCTSVALNYWFTPLLTEAEAMADRDDSNAKLEL